MSTPEDRGVQWGENRPSSYALEAVPCVVLHMACHSSTLVDWTGVDVRHDTSSGGTGEIEVRIEKAGSGFAEALAETNRLYGGMLRRLA